MPPPAPFAHTDAALASVLDEDSWTPFQPPTVDRPPDSGISVEIPIDAGSATEEPPRNVPDVGLAPAGKAAAAEPSSRVSSPQAGDPRATQPAIHTPLPADLETAPLPPPRKNADSVPVVFDEGAPGEDAASDLPPEDRVTTPKLVTADEGPPRTPQIQALPPPRARSLATLDAVEISVESEPPTSETADTSEISPEDVVSVEAVVDKPRVSPSVPPPPMRAPSNPGLSTATIKTAVVPEHVAGPPSPPPKPRPMVIVPTASPLAPPPMADTSARKRARPWWEDLFNDDFIRTMAKITDAQIVTEVNFIEESLGLDKGAMVLDLACGTGRHAIELTRRGYHVVGYDLSLAMLAKAADEAQDRDQKINFVQGDMREMTFDGTFDGVYCWNTSFGFFEEEKNAAVIAGMKRALKPGGQLMLDVINRDYVAHECPSLVWFEGDGCVCMDDMAIDWITSRMRVKRTMMMDDGRSREIEYSIRLYALHELGKLLHDNGFRVSQVSGRIATPGVFFGADSPRTLILAEKK